MEKVNEILKERGSVYGSYNRKIDWRVDTLDSMEALRIQDHGLLYTPQERMLIGELLMKLSRIATNPQHLDSVQDLAGYASLYADYIQGIEKCEPLEDEI